MASPDVDELGAREEVAEEAEARRVGRRLEDQALLRVAEEDLLEEPRDGALPRRQLRRGRVPEGEVAACMGGGFGRWDGVG